ncbi:hypothetical protein SESBI_31583 [Sesbania bispinosa]|nr:hypothetical protein SESBI_31583 [Sesbania bispinosa]
MAVDLASVTTSDSSVGYHLSAHYTSGSPEQFENIQNQIGRVPPSLLPGLAFKSVFSYRKKIDIWRSEAPKLKLVQPYDIFLSNPHVSASGIIGAAATTAFGDNSARAQVDGDRQGATSLAQDLLNSQKPNMEAVQAICPVG